MRRALTAASQCRHSDISVDDLIPILVFVIIKSGITHWIATIHFLKNFIFTEFSDGSDKGIDSFLITTLEAAIIYIQSIDLREFKKPSIKLLASETKSHRRFVSKDNFCDYLFGKILAEDEVEIIKLLKTDKEVIIHGADKESVGINDGTVQNDDDEFMKRVSDIDDEIDEGVVDEIDLISRLNLQNSHGVGAIHVAAMHGLPKMLNTLLALGVDLLIKDENNYTALHYAASRGHQNTLLLLLHAGAEINALSNDKNSALSVAALNGHSNCVKALLYYCDHMNVRIDRNAQNKFGDTALHLAAKWGFSEIIETLLEYGARVDICNRAGHRAIELAHNSHIATILQNAVDSNNQNETTSSDSAEQITRSASTTSLNHEIFRGCFSTGLDHTIDTVDSSSFLQKTKNDKIVAAIKNGDTKLACHFLGIEAPDDGSQCVCHPLCDCDKCKHITEYLSRKQVDSRVSYDANDLNICSTDDGITPLHAAIQMKNLDLTARILALGAKVSIPSKETRQTAIHLAILTKSTDILNLVLNYMGPIEHGNDIDLQDSFGNTALHVAVEQRDTQLLDAILKYEPNIRIRNSDDKTATDMAKLLLQLNCVRRLELAESNDLRNMTPK